MKLSTFTYSNYTQTHTYIASSPTGNLCAAFGAVGTTQHCVEVQDTAAMLHDLGSSHPQKNLTQLALNRKKLITTPILKTCPKCPSMLTPSESPESAGHCSWAPLLEDAPPRLEPRLRQRERGGRGLSIWDLRVSDLEVPTFVLGLGFRD